MALSDAYDFLRRKSAELQDRAMKTLRGARASTGAGPRLALPAPSSPDFIVDPQGRAQAQRPDVARAAAETVQPQQRGRVFSPEGRAFQDSLRTTPVQQAAPAAPVASQPSGVRGSLRNVSKLGALGALGAGGLAVRDIAQGNTQGAVDNATLAAGSIAGPLTGAVTFGAQALRDGVVKSLVDRFGPGEYNRNIITPEMQARLEADQRTGRTQAPTAAAPTADLVQAQVQQPTQLAQPTAQQPGVPPVGPVDLRRALRDPSVALKQGQGAFQRSGGQAVAIDNAAPEAPVEYVAAAELDRRRGAPQRQGDAVSNTPSLRRGGDTGVFGGMAALAGLQAQARGAINDETRANNEKTQQFRTQTLRNQQTNTDLSRQRLEQDATQHAARLRFDEGKEAANRQIEVTKLRDAQAKTGFEQEQARDKQLNERIASSYVTADNKPDQTKAADFRRAAETTLNELGKASKTAPRKLGELDTGELQDLMTLHKLRDAVRADRGGLKNYFSKSVESDDLTQFMPVGRTRSLTGTEQVTLKSGETVPLSLFTGNERRLFGQNTPVAEDFRRLLDRVPR